MKKRKLSKSLRKYIRKQKAIIGRTSKDPEENQKLIQDLYKRFFGGKK